MGSDRSHPCAHVLAVQEPAQRPAQAEQDDIQQEGKEDSVTHCQAPVDYSMAPPELGVVSAQLREAASRSCSKSLFWWA